LPFAQAATCVLLTTEMETAPPSTAAAPATFPNFSDPMRAHE